MKKLEKQSKWEMLRFWLSQASPEKVKGRFLVFLYHLRGMKPTGKAFWRIWKSEGCMVWSWSLAMIMKVSEQPEEQSLAVFPGKDANSIYSRMLVLIHANSICGLEWRQRSVPSSMRLIRYEQRSCRQKSSKSIPLLRRVYQHGLKITFQRGFRFLTFLSNTGEPYGQPTAWKGSARISEDEPGWLVFFQTRYPVLDWSPLF